MKRNLKRKPKKRAKEKKVDTDEESSTEVDEELVKPPTKPKAKGKRGRRQKQIGKEDMTKIEEEKRPSSKVDIARQEVYDSFKSCIESIN